MKKKYFGTWIYKLSSLVTIVILLFGVTGFSSCSKSDDDDSEEQSQVINKDIIGVWYCTFQQKSQDGDTWSFTYEPSSEYMMAFEDDGTGYMKSGKDELLEIGTHGIKNFNWYSYRKGGKNWIHTDVYDGQDYEVTSVSSSSLTLTWREPNPANDYTIICKFIKMK